MLAQFDNQPVRDEIRTNCPGDAKCYVVKSISQRSFQIVIERMEFFTPKSYPMTKDDIAMKFDPKSYKFEVNVKVDQDLNKALEQVNYLKGYFGRLNAHSFITGISLNKLDFLGRAGEDFFKKLFPEAVKTNKHAHHHDGGFSNLAH